MARMSIYVSDDLKERMDQSGDMNWSGIAQAAFATAMFRNPQMKEPVMQDVIERLRASKLEHELYETTEGKKDGRAWAMKTATFTQLRDISRVDVSQFGDDGRLARHIGKVIGEDPSDRESSIFFDHGAEALASDEYVAAFVEGAIEVWEDVKDKV
ncbi:hypothetical protein [Bosea sp. (in: a-proteobacteria)]|uniref:hypothetical protein n=1 Tax=Bosea sp. (in: a-proteobacteria) TaxID=1871050 RepID=UPI002B47E55C|nr:hypothetical protein [Bosea sp. (in: a-proteobacteria)]WRH59316.1 MAG: hypothetical protein RSE11_05915 [Bosea sp. (in: a-proteobacteria)]